MGIKVFYLRTKEKCSQLERAQRTLQSRLYHFLKANNTKRYVENLQLIVSGYNYTWHRALSCSPMEASTRRFRRKVLKNVEDNSPKKGVKRPPLFRIGDLVHIHTPSKFGRGYETQFSKSVYRVSKINRTHLRPIYTVTHFESGVRAPKHYRDYELIPAKIG